MPLPRHVFGLPLHPMLVHFPLAFWLCTPVFDGLALANAGRWWGVALGATAVGVVIGAFALITGLLDYIHLSETGSNDVRLAARHGVRTSLVWCVMAIKLLIAILLDNTRALMLVCLVVDLLVCVLLVQGAIFGTRITYGRYKNR